MENLCAKKQISFTTQGIDKLSFQVKEFKRNTKKASLKRLRTLYFNLENESRIRRKQRP